MRILFALMIAASLAAAAGCDSTESDWRKRRAGARDANYQRQIEWRRENDRLTRDIRANPRDPQGYLRRAAAHYEHGEFYPASDDYDQARLLDPQNAQAICGTASVQLQLDSPALASRTLRGALAVAPDYAPIFYWLGRAYQLSEDFDEALDHYDRAIDLNPTYADAYVGRGRVRRATAGDEGERAMADFRQAIFFDPRNVEAHVACADVHLENEQHDQAVRVLTRAAELRPWTGRIYIRRGRAYRGLEKYGEALDDFDLAAELGGMETDAYFDRGVTYLHLGRPLDALDDLSQAILNDPDNAEAFRYRGDVYLSFGYSQAYMAIDDYTQAIRLRPKYAEAYRGRATAYEMIGNRRRAEQDRRSAEKYAPAGKWKSL